jgi:hypothetical protein
MIRVVAKEREITSLHFLKSEYSQNLVLYTELSMFHKIRVDVTRIRTLKVRNKMQKYKNRQG